MRILSHLLVLFFIMTVFSACRDDTLQEKQVDQPARPAKLYTIKEVPVEWKHRFPAIVKAAESRQLYFQTSGIVSNVLAKEAEKVEMGELLIQLDDRTFKANLDSAQAQYEKAKQDFESADRLLKENAIAPTIHKERRAAFKKAEAALSTARKSLEDTQLRAPFNGLVARVPAETSQAVTPGTPAITIFSTEEFEAVINMPASLLGRYNTRTTTRATVFLSRDPAQPVSARFKEASLEADEISQTYPVSFTFTPPENSLLLPGMNATVELIALLQSEQGELMNVVIPLSSIVSDGEGEYVWVVNSDNMSVSRRNVALADSIGENVMITAGLSPNEIIVAAGVHQLEENTRVQPWPKQQR